MENVKERSFLERRFKLKQNNTDTRTEVLAGLTTFMTMAYILIVNPNICQMLEWIGEEYLQLLLLQL